MRVLVVVVVGVLVVVKEGPGEVENGDCVGW